MTEIIICSNSNCVGSLVEATETRLSESLACGRSGQSREKNETLLRFADRICDGNARPEEVAYMLALMAQDIPA